MKEKEDFKKMSQFSSDDKTQSDDVLTKLTAKVKSGKHTILTGPPGTGKTFLFSELKEI